MRRDDLRVLIVATGFPFPPRWGYGTRVYQLARQVSARHDATLLCYADPEDQPNVERLREELDVEVVPRTPVPTRAKRVRQVASLASPRPFLARGVQSRAMQRAIDHVCSGRRFAIVQLEASLLSVFRFPGDAAILVDEHNVDFEVYERLRESEGSPARKAFYRFEEARLRRFNQRAWHHAAGCAVPSEREERIVREHAPSTPTAVVPNAVDLDYFAPGGRPVRPHSLVFNGLLDYRPNLDAAQFLVDDVLPRVRKLYADVTLTIVGRIGAADVRSLRQPGVELAGEVPDVRPYLDEAAVVVVPIRSGGGTRLKVVEGLAMARPMVSTAIGCEGVDVRDGEHLLVADTADGFAARVVRLFAEPELGAELGAAGRALMAERYSWHYAGERLEELYTAIIDPRPTPALRVQGVHEEVGDTVR
jgi:polysaccharide biosynthesis protein PslH